MSKMILQMQISVDGQVSAETGDWRLWGFGPDWPWDDALRDEFNAIFAQVDTILISSDMIEEGYLDHWAAMGERFADDRQWEFARRVGAVDKVLFSNRVKASRWPRTRLVSGDMAEQVRALKARPGGDIITFGGVTFGAALLETGLVDEVQLFVNPSAVGEGRSVFRGPRQMTLTGSKAYDCGIVVNRYRP